MKSLIVILIAILITSCSAIFGDRRIDEKIFQSGDIKVKWYRVSDINTDHDFVEIERWGWTNKIMKANTSGIHDILVKDDTVTIQTLPNLLIYDLTAKTLNCYIKLDTSITICEYTKKHAPENAKYYCSDTTANHMSIRQSVLKLQ